MIQENIRDNTTTSQKASTLWRTFTSTACTADELRNSEMAKAAAATHHLYSAVYGCNDGNTMAPVQLSEIALSRWQQVPVNVAGFYKEAKPVVDKVRKLLPYLPHSPGYGYVFWHPKNKALHAVLGDNDDSHHNRWSNALRTLSGVQNVTIADEWHPRDQDDWVLIKQASPLGAIGLPLQWAGKLTGGPSPLTNAITGSLLGAGLGYAGGTAAEHLFPERFVQRGRLRRTLATLGGLAGIVPGVVQAGANAGLKTPGTEQSLGVKSIWTPNDDVPLDTTTNATINNADYGQVLKAAMSHLSTAVPDLLQRAATQFVKLAFNDAGALGLRSIPVDAFNQAVWNDVQKGMANPYGTKSPWGDDSQALHTPPQLGAATTGIVAGVSQMYNGQSMLSPRHFINGLAAAGVDLATAHLVGGTLGALGGLTPEAQNTLQNMGVWGGLIRGTVGSMLGHHGVL